MDNRLARNCGALVARVRERRPLIEQLTNAVTINDCANVTLAIGASPIMAEAFAEIGDVVGKAAALVINIGTLRADTVETMMAAAKMAGARGIPVILDPVGVGASRLRDEVAARLLRETRIDVIRGNSSEIRALAGHAGTTKGVDASEADMRADSGPVALELARRLRCIVAVTGEVDVVSDGTRAVYIKNGHAMLSRVTGTGCMCTALVGAFCGAAPERLLEATVAGVACMGVAGELAHGQAGERPGSFRVALMDAVGGMDAATMEERAKIHET